MELNTIASSFGCMSALTARMHRHLLSRFGDEASGAGKAVRDHATSIGIDTAAGATAGAGGLGQLIPDNPTLTALPGALAAAHKCYGKADAVVLFVVQPGETNAVDQRLLEMKLWDDHGVRVVRMSLAEVRVRSVRGGRQPRSRASSASGTRENTHTAEEVTKLRRVIFSALPFSLKKRLLPHKTRIQDRGEQP